MLKSLAGPEPASNSGILAASGGLDVLLKSLTTPSSENAIVWAVKFSKQAFGREMLRILNSVLAADAPWLFLDFARNDLLLKPPYDSLLAEIARQLAWSNPERAELAEEICHQFDAPSDLREGYDALFARLQGFRREFTGRPLLMIDLDREVKDFSAFVGTAGMPRNNVDFTPDDVTDFPAFRERLIRGQDPFSKWLFGRLEPSLQSAMMAANQGEQGDLRRLFVDNLNQIMLRGPVYDPVRFAKVEPRRNTLRLLQFRKARSSPIRLNRLLIEDAFPLEFSAFRLHNELDRDFVFPFCEIVGQKLGPVFLIINDPRHRGLPKQVSLKFLTYPPKALLGSARQIIGKVLPSKMRKTIVVQFAGRKPHPHFGKIIKTNNKFYAHDEYEEARVGDLVRIVESRPLSRLKRWRLAEILEQSTTLT